MVVYCSCTDAYKCKRYSIFLKIDNYKIFNILLNFVKKRPYKDGMENFLTNFGLFYIYF